MVTTKQLEAARRYRERHPDRVRAASKKYLSKPESKERAKENRRLRMSHPEVRERVAQVTRESRRNRHVMYDALVQAKYRAEDKGLPFNLELTDVPVPRFCAVLGLRLERNVTGRGPAPNSPSIDRIKPELGYVKGNVRVISHRANTLRSNSTIEELELILLDERSRA